MGKSKILIILMIAAFLPSCMSMKDQSGSVGYEPLGGRGGYVDAKVEEGVYAIAVSGNGYTSKSRVDKILILRAADLTVQNGYQSFAILADARKDSVARRDLDFMQARKEKRLREFLLKEAKKMGGEVKILSNRIVRFNAGSAYTAEAVVLMLKLSTEGINARDTIKQLKPELTKAHKNYFSGQE